MAVKSYALTTAERLSAYMDIDAPTGVALTSMEKMIDSVTDYIENATGRRFKKTTYTQEEYNTENATTLNLKHFPVISSQTFLLEKRSSTLNEND